MSNRGPDFWMRELARTGLSPADQKELLASLSNAVETRERYFPADSPTYVDRARRFLLHTFFPQLGPLLLLLDPMYPPERISRGQCWQIAHLELSLLDGSRRPVADLHNVISEVITMITRNEFPLTIPPRWLVELFGALERVVAVKMESNRWTLRPSVPLDAESQAFLEAILKNMENDKRRSQRQHVSPSVGDTEALVDASGQSLLPPEEDPPIPPIPATFPWGHRPRLWHETPRVGTPKRERADDETSSDSDLQDRPPKRRASGKSTSDTELDAPSDSPRPAVSMTVTQSIAPFPAPPIATPYGTAPQTQPQVHYSLSEIMKNPLRRYPSPKSL